MFKIIFFRSKCCNLPQLINESIVALSVELNNDANDDEREVDEIDGNNNDDLHCHHSH